MDAQHAAAVLQRHGQHALGRHAAAQPADSARTAVDEIVGPDHRCVVSGAAAVCTVAVDRTFLAAYLRRQADRSDGIQSLAGTGRHTSHAALGAGQANHRLQETVQQIGQAAPGRPGRPGRQRRRDLGQNRQGLGWRC